MLPDFRIQNFRCFRDLHLKGLGRVNLLVGKNNTGKSTVLEALSLWSKEGSPAVIQSILQTRSRAPTDPADQVRKAMSLFRDGADGAIGSPYSLTLGPTGDSLVVRLVLVSAGRQIEDLNSRLIPHDAKWQLFYEGTDVGLEEVPLDIVFSETKPSIDPWGLGKPRAITVPVGGLYWQQLQQFWSNIAGNAGEDEVVSALQLIEPDVASVRLLVDAGGRLHWRIRRRNRPEAEPLESFGDGMRRVLELALALVNSRKGMILIDEFENGIHFEAEEPLWRWLLEAATKLDVQVFATTHSLDCVRGFTNAIADHPEQGTLYRLARWRGDIMAFAMDEQDLVTAARHEMEVR